MPDSTPLVSNETARCEMSIEDFDDNTYNRHADGSVDDDCDGGYDDESD